MPAKDTYHDAFRNALTKDGWVITHDPFHLSWGGKEMYVDLGAEYVLAAERMNRRIAIEIKSFLGNSLMDDLEKALGQFVLYRSVLAKRVAALFDEPLGKLLLEDNLVQVISFDPVKEVLVRWIP